jgi:hypothetical protein
VAYIILTFHESSLSAMYYLYKVGEATIELICWCIVRDAVRCGVIRASCLRCVDDDGPVLL